MSDNEAIENAIAVLGERIEALALAAVEYKTTDVGGQYLYHCKQQICDGLSDLASAIQDWKQ